MTTATLDPKSRNTQTQTLSHLFETQRENIDYFFKTVDIEQCETLLNTLLNCKGTLFFTGIGKSGLVAKKIVASMISTGTKSLYISPINALHGDLGIVKREDIFIFLSKSGESDELLSLIPFIRNKGATPVAVVCENDNRLTKACSLSILLPIHKELCPFNLAPTTSATIQMIFGDIVCIALMQKRGFSIDDFASNHPAGRIGKRITLKVGDLMVKGKELPVCSGDTKLVDSLSIFSSKACGCILINDSENNLEGIFTDGDLRRALQKHAQDVLQEPLSSLMTPSPRVISPELLAWEAMKEMEADPKRPITVLPVVDHKRKVLGLLKMHDILQLGL